MMRPVLVIKDLCEALKKWRLWCYLGWSDIKVRYQRSVLGPWWITISMGIFILTMSIVYTRVLHQNVKHYVPFLTCNFLIWGFISTSLNESPCVFSNAKSFISQIKLPLFTHIFRQIVKNTIFLLHNAIIFLIVLIIFKIEPKWTMLLAIPGFLLIAFNISWITLLMGICGSRFRDIIPIVNSLVIVLFFVSPITWGAKLIGQNSKIILLNPITYFLNVFRDPLLGHAPTINSWIILFTIAIFGYLFSFILFSKFYQRIAFWVE